MKLFEKKSKFTVIKNLDISNKVNCLEAQLIYIEGAGKLKTSISPVSDDYYGYVNQVQATLNDIPLLYAHQPGCPTCASLIATGYGIEATNCKELKVISSKMNSNFISLETSIHDLNPLLSLLETGLYVIADMLCYPTDGNENFFWNPSNDYTENPSTGMVWLNDEDFDSEWIDGQPSYLFPTQSSKNYNSIRVNEYIEQFKLNTTRPRAIAYHFSHFLNFLLDGHHKACASTLIGEAVNTLVIIPLTSQNTKRINNLTEKVVYNFANFILSEDEIPQQYQTQGNIMSNTPKKVNEVHHINTRVWEECYKNKARLFPTVKELAMTQATTISVVNEKTIQKWIESNDKENYRKLRTLLALWKIKNDVQLKELALKCAHKVENSLLKEESFRALCLFKDDIETEEFFVEYLVKDEDPHSLLRIIANSYWDK